MKLLYRVLRFIAVVMLCLSVLIPAVSYVALSLTPVQRRIALVCEDELSRLLGCRVTVGDLGIVPFNRVVLRNVTVETAPGDTVLTVRRLGAGVSLWSVVAGDAITVNYVELIGMDARISRATPDAPLNIQPIIDALQPGDKSKPPTQFNLRINTVLLRSSKVCYDVHSVSETDRFNPAHVGLSSVRADIRIPRLKNNDFIVNVKRMGFRERHGFVLENLIGEMHLSDSVLSVRNFGVTLPGTNLQLADVSLPLHGIGSLGNALRNGRLDVGITDRSYLSLSDFGAIVPALRSLDWRIDFRRFAVTGNPDSFSADVELRGDNGLRVELAGEVEHLTDRNRRIEAPHVGVAVPGNELGRLVGCFASSGKGTNALLSSLGEISIDGSVSGNGDRLKTVAVVSAAPGSVNINADAELLPAGGFRLDADVAATEGVDLEAVLPGTGAGMVAGVVHCGLSRVRGRFVGDVAADFDYLTFKGAAYTGLHAEAELTPDEVVQGSVSIDNEAVSLDMAGAWSVGRHHKVAELEGEIRRFIPSMLNLWDKYPGGDITGRVHASFTGPHIDNMMGRASLHEVALKLTDGECLRLNSLELAADSARITLRSDYVDGELCGGYCFPQLVAECRDIFARSFPAIAWNASVPLQAGVPAEVSSDADRTNDFRFDITVKETETLADFLHLPVSVVYPVSIAGEISRPQGEMALTVDAPYLRQGTKLIENTRLSASAGGDDSRATFDLATTVPTKNGPMTLSLQNTGRRDCLNSAISWKIDRAQAYNGAVGAVTTFVREDDGRLVTTVNIQPGELTFNDSTWRVNPAKVVADGPKHIVVSGVNVHRSNQFVKIDGIVADDAMSLLTLDLRNFSLDYLFESLGIDKVMLGGDASGTFYASGLLTPQPVLETPGLNVKAISYNKTVIGDALVKSRWDAERRAVTLDAAIEQEGGHRSFVDGAIFPMNDSLDITFTVDHARIGFMQPYMEAFASDISGYASGRARIFGDFKYIDLEGDVRADELRLKVNFTNTYYTTAGDSVHFRPGLIDLNGITIRDAEGHPANLNGWVRHKFFKEPRFQFGITGAHDFLSYNETPRENPVWYGKIYGDGSAFVKGEPGRIDISVDMATASRSTFTFVLSDQEVADEYSFLTFRDKNRMAAELSDTLLLARDTSMDLVNRLKAMVDAHSADAPSDYNISLQMRVTPEAQIVLVMDPVGGDRIRAYGSGHLRMDYGSANNDLKMYGTYTLDRGDYNFTLQDVIIKDFIIKPGSEIVFNGDPYGALLKIEAVYALNANLSDLDESFLQDKDLNRTNVPVHALMKVNGDIRQPEITFDLEFPTLTTDIYRKVRSIISTDDMMNRQIIYLLALNRFYTPEYMTSTTKGNELVSVASSTISSQLSNMLGQISDNWNIAPTFRSDRGDFSDVEVDVALSSRLLNNRLLFNGNFGYRDNTLNTSQFIGDFDLEYILDREGMWRLKAYNRYNDQNYYLRTAHTTQGVGVVLKRDFDSFLSFIRRLGRKKDKQKNSDGGNAVPEAPESDKQ